MKNNDSQPIEFVPFNVHQMHLMVKRSKDVPSIFDYINRALKQKKEELFVKVLTDYLDRTPTEDDARKCTLANNKNYPGIELLAYDNVVLGRIEAMHYGVVKIDGIDGKTTMGYRFVPCVNTFE